MQENMQENKEFSFFEPQAKLWLEQLNSANFLMRFILLYTLKTKILGQVTHR